MFILGRSDPHVGPATGQCNHVPTSWLRCRTHAQVKAGAMNIAAQATTKVSQTVILYGLIISAMNHITAETAASPAISHGMTVLCGIDCPIFGEKAAWKKTSANSSNTAEISRSLRWDPCVERAFKTSQTGVVVTAATPIR